MISNITADYRARDAAHHLHPFSEMRALNAEGSRVVVRGEGSWIWDSDGRRALDGMSGLWCVNIGHGRREIAAAVTRQMAELSYTNTFFKSTHPPAIALAEKIATLTQPHLSHVFFTGSGSEANDTVVRMVRHYWAERGKPAKQVIISRRNAYHGSTMAGASLGGMKPMHAQGGLPIPGIVHRAQPYWFGEGGEMSPEEFGIAAARDIEAAIEEIGEDNIAAFIAEPIQGAGGVIIPPETYWPEIARILAGREILTVADEVICGFGRTGRWFGSDFFGIRPDLMSIAKGLSSGYLPIGGVVVSSAVAEVLSANEFNHGFTYSAHPVCCAAALENLRILEEERLVDRVAEEIGPYLQRGWRALADHPLVGEARMVGLIGALELVPDKPSRSVAFPDTGKVGTLARDLSIANGLVMRAVRDSLIIAPPFTLSFEEADFLLAAARKTLDDTLDAARRLGLKA
ncbi:aspartate aminotransferase family protein [Prosthecomicrobium pneumaticum]|uniref:Putrescine aminotransferase n=1 Tax=Prosthecomicrobium pneumaticum TaxID=81895 RepID=A0A7W9CVX1_9HYPH|nr:aspartate aminotransferase family protein [Prosthecomicrobium pneumaticum]MBB5752327.1 putrescine aminotransferase [Prosthecomicrobium pneumaticum]